MGKAAFANKIFLVRPLPDAQFANASSNSLVHLAVATIFTNELSEIVHLITNTRLKEGRRSLLELLVATIRNPGTSTS